MVVLRMDNDLYFDVATRSPFASVHLPPLARLYKFAYDNASLANPRLLAGRKTLPRILAYLAMRGRIPTRQGIFTFFHHKGARECTFDPRNTQFHSIYFDRFKSGYEPDVCAALDLLLEPDTILFDIGANWGFFSGYVASRPDFKGEIHAFEPLLSSYNDLVKFINDAAIEKTVSVYNLGLSSIDGYCEMNLPDRIHSGLAQVSRLGAGQTRVARLDSIRLPPPHIMKIDAEYHEAEILHGAVETITKSLPFIIFESSLVYGADDTSLEPFRLLKTSDYAFFDLGWRSKYDRNLVRPHRHGLRSSLVLLPFSLENRLMLRPRMNVLAVPRGKLSVVEQGLINRV
jgi:FkbM family methyltransferase